MGVPVEIKITSEAQLEGVKAAEQEMGRLGASTASLAPATAAAGQEMTKMGRAIESPYQASRALRTGLAQISAEMGVTGPAAHALAFGLLDSSEGFTRMTGAMIGAGVGLSALINSIKIYQEAPKEVAAAFEPKNIKATGDEIQKLNEQIDNEKTLWGTLLKPIQMVGAAVGLIDKNKVLTAGSAAEKAAALELGQTNARLQLTEQLNRKIENQAELIGKTLPEAIEIEARQAKIALAEQNREWGLSTDQLHRLAASIDDVKARKFADDFTKSAMTTGNFIAALGFETAALGKTGSAALDVAEAQRIYAIRTSELARTYPALAAAEEDATHKAYDFKRAMDAINQGQAGVGKFEQQFGVTLPGTNLAAGANLADQFAATFNVMKGDSKNAAALNAAFTSLIQQAVALGLPNITDLLMERGLSSSDLAQLKQSLAGTNLGFQEVTETVTTLAQTAAGSGQLIAEEITKLVPIMGSDLVAAIDKSDQGFVRWGIEGADALKKLKSDAYDVGINLNATGNEANAATQAVARLKSGLDGLQDKIVHITVVADGDTSFLSNQLSTTGIEPPGQTVFP